MKVEVLCTTMFQKDLSKYYEMNIQTDVVFANQDDRYEFIEENINGNTIKMVTTPYRGVGKNRNLALLYSNADILMFSDDDMVYVDGYANGVIKAFESLPEADMIIFHCTTNSNRAMPDISRISRVRLWNFMRYGTFSFVIKNESLIKYNMNFSQLFGGGTKYCSGEDNLLLREALRKKLKVYSHTFTIAAVNHGESTWFKGFNEKFFFDNGALLEASFSFLKNLFIWYFVFKFSKETEISMKDIWKLHYEGMKAYKKGLSFDEWRKEKL